MEVRTLIQSAVLSESSSQRQTSAPARHHHLVVYLGHMSFKESVSLLLPASRRLSISTRRPRPLHSLLTNQGLPLPIGLCDLIGAAHLAERNAADDEDDDAGPGAVLSGRLVLVPVAVASAAGTQRTGRHNQVTVSVRHQAPSPPSSHLPDHGATLNTACSQILYSQQLECVSFGQLQRIRTAVF